MNGWAVVPDGFRFRRATFIVRVVRVRSSLEGVDCARQLAGQIGRAHV